MHWDLASIVSVSFSNWLATVSKHLAVLKRAGIVIDRREGVQISYRLRIPCILQVFPCVAAVMQADQHEKEWNVS
jgi:hypothetical protein